MLRGDVDSDITVDIYKPRKACFGTTLLPDNHNPQQPRIIEVNMLGEIIWHYEVPEDRKQYTNPGFDVGLLPNNNILFVLPRNGVYEIDRRGNEVWNYQTAKISHDADRLPSGNTIFVFGDYDTRDDWQVTEVNQEKEIVWHWQAKDHRPFNKSPYDDPSLYDEGWTHTNAVTRLPNGDTLISLRNFNLIVVVKPSGRVVRTIEGIYKFPHDPQVLPYGNILAMHVPRRESHFAIEIDREKNIIWEFEMPDKTRPARDANRLPNGNTLITGATEIVEVTRDKEIVWRLILKDATFGGTPEAAGLGFYKTERISAQR